MKSNGLRRVLAFCQTWFEQLSLRARRSRAWQSGSDGLRSLRPPWRTRNDTHRLMRGELVVMGVTLLVLLLAVDRVFSHCDTMGGPVITDAKAALNKGDVKAVSKWVQKAVTEHRH